jgi:hypothetical protein
VSGLVKLLLPGAFKFYPIEGAVTVPLGSTVDAANGTAGLVTSKGGGAVQAALFGGGKFTVSQQVIGQPTTSLRLAGGNFAACGASGRGSSSARPVRRLRTHIGRRPGKYRVRGRHSIAGAVGTTWVTEDRCDGTLTRVESGTVDVRDFGRHRTVVVHARHSYLARAR